MHEEVNTNRVDMFYFSTFNIGKNKELSMILKTILALSHGNATVKHGFSINKNMANVNISQESIVAQCLVKDHIIANNLTLSTTKISKEMLVSVKQLQVKFAEHLEEKRHEQQIQKRVTSKGH